MLLVLLIVALASRFEACSGDSSSPPPSSSATAPTGDPPSSPPSSPPPSDPPPSPATLSITTTSLPTGRVGQSYAITLAETGGTAPFSWTVTQGALPAGLALNSSTGAIAGTPDSPADHAALNVQVKDSGNPAQTASVQLSLTINPAVISVSISPKRAALTSGQSLSLKATTGDYAGVTWSISPKGGSFSSTTSLNGAAVTLTAPSTPGVYTVTAASVSDSSQSSAIMIGVTDLAGVYTYHNDLARNGLNDHEYALTPSNVNTGSFGKLFTCKVDGAIYTQPLWMANVTVKGVVRNVVFVATQHDTLYAFDADASPCVQLWASSLIDVNHGGTGGEVPVPTGTTGYLAGTGAGDITPETGIIGTPVIDPASNTLYVVSKSMNAAGTSFYQRLHAIDVFTGNERTGSPVTITATYPGSGDGGSTVTFDARTENQRAGLALVNGRVYIAWGSHEDAPIFYGWIMGYDYNGSYFTRSVVFNTAPNTTEAGIWMSGVAPAVDSGNNLYVLTGNGGFDADSATPPNNDYGDSLLQLSSSLQLLQYFTPSNQAFDNVFNNDFGSGGAVVLADLPAGSPITHLLVAGGKDGNLYIFNRDSLGGYGDAHAWQIVNIGPEGDLNADTPGVIFTAPAIWNNHLYIAGVGQPLKDFPLDLSTAKLAAPKTGNSPTGGFAFPGSTPSVSSAGSAHGIVWLLDNSQFCTKASPGCGPSVLHAYDAADISNELWNSSKVSSDAAGNAVKFAVPTIANGRIYVGTRGDNTGGATGSTSISGALDVFGLKPD